MATITCTACGFSAQIGTQGLKPELMRAKCSRCGHGFVIDGAALLAQGGSGLELDFGSSQPPAPAPPPNADPAAAPYAVGVVEHSSPFVSSNASATSAAVTYSTPASFLSRAMAYFVDSAIVSGLDWMASKVVIAAMPSTMRLEFEQPGRPDPQVLLRGGKYLAVLLLVQLTIYFLVVIVPLTRWGRTPGKAALGLRVVTANGETPGLFRSLLRETLGKGLSSCILYLGFLLALFDERHQALHDKIAGTFVVEK